MDYRFYLDTEDRSVDKYTIVIEYDQEDYEWGENDSMLDVFGASEWPFHPQGLGQYCGDYVSDEFLDSQAQIFWDALPYEIKIYALVCGYWGGKIDLSYRWAADMLEMGVVETGKIDYGDWYREEVWFPGVVWGGYDDESEATV
jgi:hypothetical protein